MPELYLYIIVMAGITYLIRMLPLVLFRRRIKSRFLNSFLYYIPYTVLAAMTFPAIFFCTDSVISASIGAAVALILAYFNQSLLVVAAVSAAAIYLSGFFV